MNEARDLKKELEEREREIKYLKIANELHRSSEQNSMSIIKQLRADKYSLEERILDLEACQ